MVTKMLKLPEDAHGDYNLIMNSLPDVFDLRTDWAKALLDEVSDFVIDKAREVAKFVEVSA